MRGFSRLAKVALKRPAPVYLILFVTARCNAACGHCFYWRNVDAATTADELSVDEIRRTIESLGPLLQVSLTGGEPFLRDDFVEVCAAVCRAANPLVITIPTNGFLTRKITSDLEAILPQNPRSHFRISLSLDALHGRHDALRGVDGGFANVCATYKVLERLRDRNPNLSIDLCTVMSAFNRNEVDDVFDYVEREMTADNHLLTLVRGMPRNEAALSEVLPDYERMIPRLLSRVKRPERKPFHRFLAAVYEEGLRTIVQTAREERQVVPCVAGRSLIEITETGNVVPCELLDLPMGNIRDFGYDVPALLKSPAAVATIKSICRGECYCTFECAVNTSILFDVGRYPRLFLRTLARL